MSANKAFYQWSRSEGSKSLQHFPNCLYTMPKHKTYTPIDECSCDCNDFHIFRAGYLAAKGIKDDK